MSLGVGVKFLFIGEEFRKAMNTVLGSGVFNSDGTKIHLSSIFIHQLSMNFR